MATSSTASTRSLLSYYGPRAGPDGLKLGMPVTPEELEFFAEQEMVTIIPNFSLESGETLFCIGGNYGPFQPNMPTHVPLWLAIMLLRRHKCRIQAPDWMLPDNLQAVFDEEKAVPMVFQPLPFYYVEIAQALYRNDPSSTFGGEEEYARVRHLVEAIRKVRYSKIEAGLRKVGGPITVKLNNLAAAECNMIRLLFKGTLDHFYELGKNNKAWTEAAVTNASMSLPM
eukprot:CAMPEP_0202859202 /NCGR_PEP_ID=MMETSP1391-20130828/1423_1 /ASSEMBLY_ACC=CAM_ASM_000867 /TAXON_ID=1034604 /ORGANISM="Chlamydomonas leiostraca, Strain SAG 11-49" /LENGTH=226 /DNA_ID=CAMNT_0049538217 /DNA_START=974 /DNA_END=1654 /DNA_ORIENTATION=+